MSSKDLEMTSSQVKSLRSNPTFNEALALFDKDIVLNGIEQVRAQIAELKVFDPISDGYNRSFGEFERSEGELFVPVRRGWPQPNVVTNPDPENPAVIQVNKVLVDGKETSFGSLLKAQFPDKEFDCYDLAGAGKGSDMLLEAADEKAIVKVLRDETRKALAVLRRG